MPAAHQEVSMPAECPLLDHSGRFAVLDDQTVASIYFISAGSIVLEAAVYPISAG